MQPHYNLLKLPPISVNQHCWDGANGTLAFYLRCFCEQFAGYGDFGVISFLCMCIPKNHLKDIEASVTLEDILDQLGQWASDSKIHMECMEMELHNMPQCTSLEQDRYTLRKQIAKINNCMEISNDFYLNISMISTYLVKYFEPSLYPTMSNHLHTIAINNGDPKGHGNYVGPFLCSLKQQL